MNPVFGNEYLKFQDFENESSKYKMVVFLSEKCPCSKSHIDHLKEIIVKHPELKVYGVVSEPAQSDKEAKIKAVYFKNTDFGFPIINDSKQVLVKKYKAFKTPHAVLLAKNNVGNYEVVYQGGLTDSKTFSPTSKKYIEEAMGQLAQKQDVKVKNGFCLGCYIRRF